MVGDEVKMKTPVASKPHILREHLINNMNHLSCVVVALLILLSPHQTWAKRSKTKVGKSLPIASPIEMPLVPDLTELERSALAQIRPDPAPEKIVRNSHYWVSNEHNHDLWRPYIEGIGGALVGVGTDQNYLLAGWAKPQLLILMDFDEEISILHEIYEHLFTISDTSTAFTTRWTKPYHEDTSKKLTAHFTSRAAEVLSDSSSARARSRWVRRRVKVYRVTRALIYRRLKRTLKKYTALKIPTFLDDQAQYDYIRSLWAQGRVIAIRGDLTADLTMLDIAKALKTIQVPLNILYLSNAEQYFGLTPEYRRNIIAQPWGEKSVALRTLGWRILGYVDEKEKYHYNVQLGTNFKEWLEINTTSKTGRILIKAKTDLTPPGFSIVTTPPPEGKRRPKVAPTP
jgi:hypothetical protein